MGITLVHLHPLEPGTGSPAFLRISDRKFATEPGDSVQPNKLYWARLKGGLVWREQIFERSTVLGGKTSGGIGKIPISNVDKWLDQYFAYVWKRTSFEILYSEAGRDLADFENIFYGVVTGFSLQGSDVVLTVRDNNETLEAPVQVEKFLGTATAAGQVTGMEPQKDLLKPDSFGRTRKAPSLLINPIDLTYQQGQSPGQAIDAVYDGVNPYTLDRDDLTGAGFDAHTPQGGHFSVDLQRMIFRLGTRAQKVVTADTRGRLDGGVYSGKVADIIKQVASLGENPVTVSAADIAAINAVVTHEAGFFLPAGEATTKGEVIGALTEGLGIHYFVDDLGVLRLELIEVPDQAKSEITISDQKGAGLQILKFKIEKIAPPIKTAVVSYRPRWDNGETENAPVAVVGQAALEGQVGNQLETFKESVENAGVSDHWGEPPYELSTYFWERAGATAAGNRFNARQDQVRYFAKVSARIASVLPRLNAVATVTVKGESAFESGRPMLVLKREYTNRKKIVDLVLWG